MAHTYTRTASRSVWAAVLALGLVCPAGGMPGPSPGALTVTIGGVDEGQFSPYLATMSLVYCWARDALYKNGSMAAWARQHRLATARYPAGTASYWNWENPTGEMGNSSLDPQWKGPGAAASEWMSLDEYLDLCAAAHLRPLVGVNYNCHGHFYVSEAESIARAVRQVQHVVARGFPGAFYYIGNEDGSFKYMDRIAAHVAAMKKADPSLKAFWNDNDITAEKVAAVLHKTGSLLSGVEFHGKWPLGGKQPDPTSEAEWLLEVPLVDHRRKVTWRNRTAALRAAAVASGRPDLLLANNEYGLGKPSQFINFTRFTKGLVNIEFNLELFKGNYSMASLWDTSDGGYPGRPPVSLSTHMLTDSSAGFRFNPSQFGIALLARAANGTRLGLAVQGPGPDHGYRVHGIATREGGPTPGAILCHLINKYPTEREVVLHLPAAVASAAMHVVSDTPDHWGRLDVVPASATAGARFHCTPRSTTCTAVLPAVSFAMFEFRS